jgi:hypothetical protein
MPKFRVTDSQTGRSVIVSGDSAPSEAEAEEIFSAAGLRSQQPASDSNILTNFLPSLGRNVQGMVDAVTHPVETTQGLAALSGGLADRAGVQNIPQPPVLDLMGLIPNPVAPVLQGARNTQALSDKLGVGKEQRSQVVDATADFYKDRYGGVENVKRTVNEDPVGALLDLSTVLGGAGSLLKGVGTTSKISALTKVGSGAQKFSAAIDPINVGLKATGKVGQIVTKPFGKAADVLEAEAKNLPLGGVRITPNQMKEFEKTHKISVQDFIKQEKLSGNPVEEALKKAEKLQDDYDVRVKNTNIEVDADTVVNALNKRIQELSDPLDPPAQKLASQLKEYRDLYNAQLGGTRVKVDRLLELRNKARKNMRSSKDFQVDPDTANVNTQLYRTLNDVIYDAAGGSKLGSAELRGMGRKLRTYYDFIEKTEKTNLPAAKSRLGEFIKGAGVATAITNPATIPALLAGYGVKRLVSNPTVLGAGSAALEGTVRGSRAAGSELTSRLSAMQRALKKTNDAARNSGVRQLPQPMTDQ